LQLLVQTSRCVHDRSTSTSLYTSTYTDSYSHDAPPFGYTQYTTQETVGSALAITILSGGHIPLWAGCIIVSLSAFSLLLLEQLGFRQLEALFGLFIGVEALTLGINFFQAPIAAKDVAMGVFVPRVRV
jgi:hypothetical protein